ncbi:MAG: nuclear transport factor 2 family protein [Balneolaceae bacterium]|nr:nuclear transport factor 2 family protein [Balneolaceae bacterium]
MKNSISAHRGLVLLVFILSYSLTLNIYAQSAKSLHEKILSHYQAINTGEGESVRNHHLSDFSIFSRSGAMLVKRSDRQTAEKVAFSTGAENDGSEGSCCNVVPYNFSAQIYDNVGVATFYLWGMYGTGDNEVTGLWRVSAVWVFEDEEWKEAHHHESPVKLPGSN